MIYESKSKMNNSWQVEEVSFHGSWMIIVYENDNIQEFFQYFNNIFCKNSDKFEKGLKLIPFLDNYRPNLEEWF